MSEGLLPQLLRCVEQNDSLALRMLRESETSTLLRFALKEKRRDGTTVLHLAALLGRYECMEQLLEMQAEVDIRARRAAFRETPLHMAASKGFSECVELLLRHGADVNALSITDETPQTLAVYHQKDTCAEILARAKAKQLEKERQIRMQELAFFAACCNGDVSGLQELIEERPSFVSCKDSDGYTPMQRACVSSQCEVVKYLISKGACLQCVHEETRDSLLHLIARTAQNSRAASIARCLLDADPSLAAMQNRDAALPLHVACESGNLALTTVLLRFQEQVMQLVKTCYCPDLGSEVGVDGFSFEYLKPTISFWLDKDSINASEVRRTHGIDDTLKWETEFGERRFSQRNSGDMVDAACSGHGLMFAVNSQRTSDGNTPVHLAIIGNSHCIVRQLLLYGGFVSDGSIQPLSPRVTPTPGQAPRILSNNKLFDSEYSCVKLTIENGRGYQPLHEAIVFGHAKLMYILGASEEENLFRSNLTKFKVEHHELGRSLSLLELAVASRYLDVLGLLLVHHDTSDFMSKGLQLAGELDFTSGASIILAKMVHDSCAKFFREQISRDGLRYGNKELLNVGQIVWEKIGLKVLEADYLQLASWVVGRFTKTAQGFMEKIFEMTTPPSQAALDSMLETIFERSSSCALTSFRTALVAPPALTSNLITVLNLSQNHLTSVPLAIFQLPQLRMLILSENELTELPVPSSTSVHYSCEEDARDMTPAEVISFALTPADRQYNCQELAQIQLEHNKLQEIPGVLFELVGLEMLDVSNNHLTSLPFEMWTAEKLRSLRANNNAITSLPTAPLTPEQMDVSGSPSSALMASRQMSRQGLAQRSSYIAQHQPHTTTTGEYRQRRSRLGAPVTLPEDAEITYPLKKLFLVKNHLKTIPTNLHCLAPNLEEFDVSSNHLETMNILSLPGNILVFRATQNRLKSITSERITEPCAWLLVESWATNASTPTTHSNPRLVNCKHVIGNLPRLSSLRLTDNQLSHLDLTVSCSQVTVQNAANGDLEDSADIAARNSGSASSAGNSNSSGYGTSSAAALSGIPDGCTMLLPSLAFLYIDKNEFTEVPDNLHLCRALNVLYIGDNDITMLPEDLGNLHHLYQLDVARLQLKNMHAAVLDRGNKAIISYLRGIKAQSVEHRRMKLMIVGRHGQGKTTLVKALRDGGSVTSGRTKQKQLLSTVGVDVQCWCSVTRSTKPFHKAPQPISFCVWDFGGQEEYYATHQCFLSRRALYIAVWNMETGLSGICELQPWLVNIQARAPGSTVIIVGTHLDRVVQTLAHSQVQELREEVRGRYLVDSSGQARPGLPNVVDTMEVSALKSNSVRELRDLVYNVASEIRVQGQGSDSLAGGPSQRMIDQKIPGSYRVLEEAVRSASSAFDRDGRIPVLTSAEYVETMLEYSGDNKDKLPHADELNAATSFLHDYGVLLHYEEPALQDLYFISPQWLCHTLSRVIAVKEVNGFAKKGVMKVSDLQFLLKFESSRFPPKIFDQCVSLMERFEIALRISDTMLLLPSMLPQRYEEGQRTTDFCGNRGSAAIDDLDGVTQSFSSLGSSPPSHRQAIASTFRKLPSLTRRRLEAFRRVQLGENASSMLLPPRGDMPGSIDDCDFNPGEDFGRIYVTPYPPSGFWPRLISRILSDKMMGKMLVQDMPASLSQPGLCPHDLIDWICWRSGIELHLAWCPVMRVCRLNDTMTSAANCDARVFCSGKWHALGPVGHSGVEVFVNVHAIREVLDILHSDSQAPLPRSSENVTSSSPRGLGRDEVDKGRAQAAAARASQPLQSLSAHSDGRGAINVRPGRLSHSRSVAHDQKPSNLRQRRSRLAMMVADSLDTFASPSGEPTPMIGEDGDGDPFASLRDWPELAQRAVEAAKGGKTAEKLCTACPRKDGSRLAVWLLARVVSHIDSLLFKWYDGLHSNEGYSASQSRPSIIRVVPCPRCLVEVRKRMSTSCETGDTDAESMPESAFDMANGLAQRIFKATTNPPQAPATPRSRSSNNPVSLQPTVDEEDWVEATEEEPLRVFSLCDVATKADGDVDISGCEIECERHGGLSTLRLAPDLFFADIPAEKVVTTADYVQCTSLDRGGFGEVFNGRLFKTKSGHPHPVAIKNFDLGKDPTEEGIGELYKIRQALKLYTSARAEIGILANLKHDNIVELLGVNRKPIRMLMARAPAGNLKHWLAKYRGNNLKLPPDTLHACLTQTASALEYLHDNQIIYRDLKPSNTLVWSFPAPSCPDNVQCEDNPVVLRLADYGISQFCSPSGIKGLKDGTRVYMAPEVVQFGGKETFNEKVDVYAYGANMYEMLTLTPPYANEGLLKVAENIRKGILHFPRRHRRRFLQVHQLMRWCLRLDPRQRPSFKQVCSVLAAPGFLRLVHKVRITDSSTVTAGVGQMPCPVTIGDDPSYVAGSGGTDLGLDVGSALTTTMQGNPTSPTVSVFPPAMGSEDQARGSSMLQSDVQVSRCMSTVWLGDGTGSVTMVDYRPGRSPKAPSVKICKSHITGLLAVGGHIWIGSELDGLFIYDTSLSRCHHKWLGQGLGRDVSFVQERPLSVVTTHSVRLADTGLLHGHSMSEEELLELEPETTSSDPISIAIAPATTSQHHMRFRTVCILAVPSAGLVLVAHGDGSLAVFSNNVLESGAGEFRPLKNHNSIKGRREVSSLALVRPQAGVEEVWIGLQSGDVLVANSSQLLSDELLVNIDPGRVIDVPAECPEYKLRRRIRLITSTSASMAGASLNATNSSSTSTLESEESMESPDTCVDTEVWMAMDRMPVASCWSTSTRRLVKPCGVLNCQSENIVPRLPAISQLQHDRETRVTAILPLSDKVIVGTGGGHIVVASLEPLQPLSVFSAYHGSVMCLLPYSFPVTKRRQARSIRRVSAGFTIKPSSTPANDLEGRELVLSCGQAYRGLYTGPGPADDNALSSFIGAADQVTEGHLLMWLVDDFQQKTA